eukprot:5507636-Karenia_brevis.AAC.1
MRNGQVYLRDYNDFVDVYQDSKTGLRVINVSQFPKASNSLPLSAYVPDYAEKCTKTCQNYWTDSPSLLTPS